MRSDSTKVGLPAVQVYVSGTQLAGLTDSLGRYELQVGDEFAGDLTFQLVGYVTETLPLPPARHRGRNDVTLLSCGIYLQ